MALMIWKLTVKVSPFSHIFRPIRITLFPDTSFEQGMVGGMAPASESTGTFDGTFKVELDWEEFYLGTVGRIFGSRKKSGASMPIVIAEVNDKVAYRQVRVDLPCVVE